MYGITNASIDSLWVTLSSNGQQGLLELLDTEDDIEESQRIREELISLATDAS